MDAQYVKEKIEKGEYKIEYVCDCNCHFYWNIDRHGRLDNGADNNECWEGRALMVDDDIVADRIRWDEDHIYVNDLEHDDIPEEIWIEMEMSGIKERGEGVNPEHDNEESESLIEWLIDCGYELEWDKERGFANEYTMVLRQTDDPNHKNSQEDAERWAKDFLYAGDPATEAFVGFRLELAEDEDAQ